MCGRKEVRTSEPMRMMIAQFEGLKLEAYRDAVGVLTIGYGHTGKDVRVGQRITADEADRLLAADLERFERAVESYADKVEQHQFDALVSFAYNLGEGALKGSTLLKLHNSGEYNAAAREFQRWNHAGGRVLAGLTRRREAEARVYDRGDYSS